MNKFIKHSLKFMKRWHLQTLICNDGDIQFEFELRISGLNVKIYKEGYLIDSYFLFFE